MSDFDKKLKTINRRIGQIIAKEEREIVKKYARLLTEIRALLAKQYEDFEKDGKLTLEEMLRYDRLTKLNKTIQNLLHNHYSGIYKGLNKVLKEVYLDGYYLTAWAVESTTLTKLGYSSVSPETLTAMLNNPVAGLTLKQRLEKYRNDIIYTIQGTITDGLQNNESYSTMAKRLKTSLEDDAVKAMRIVRTEGHRVQESAKFGAAEHATKNGVIMVKQWNTMEDSRVRRKPQNAADHKKLDGKKLPIDGLFNDGLSKGTAPGLLPAAGSSINCRCFLTYSIEKIEKPQHKELENMAFEKWEKERLKI